MGEQKIVSTTELRLLIQRSVRQGLIPALKNCRPNLKTNRTFFKILTTIQQDKLYKKILL